MIPQAGVYGQVFSFLYNGESSESLLRGAVVSCFEEDGASVREYCFPDGLTVTQRVTVYPGFHAAGWEVFLHNAAPEPSGLISQLFDADITHPFEIDTLPPRGYSVPEGTTSVTVMGGSYCHRHDFLPQTKPLLPGKTVAYSPDGGRSSDTVAPFFDVHRGDEGVVCAVGWTGCWTAQFTRQDDGVRMQSGIRDTALRLLPGETVRTSSFLLMRYDGGRENGHNRFRRLLKQHYSILGKPGRPSQAPHCIMSWGALPTEQMLERLSFYKKHALAFEYFWVDAGWYGSPDGFCPSEHVGDWGRQTGNWEVNLNTHPDAMQEVAAAVRENAMKFLLWIEPERAVASNPVPRARPELFLRLPGSDGEHDNLLLDLGNPDAFKYALDTVSGHIERFDLGCYRQDFNMDPLAYWEGNDEPERRGMNEIRHINGLYALWDALLARFPGLIIDNCASGGRRIDIETLRRSVPLWRSDYQCVWDADAEATQTQHMAIAYWLPYSGTGNGFGIGDTYKARSCYSSSFVSSYWGYEGREPREDDALDWVRAINAEFLRARPYFAGDYYALTQIPVQEDSWAAFQYDRPEHNDGMILVFRRSHSVCECARLALRALVPGRVYRFEDADTGQITRYTAEDLGTDGWRVQIPEKRESRLYFYTAVSE